MFDFIYIDTMITGLACVVESVYWMIEDKIRDKADSMEENIIDVGAIAKKAKEKTESERHLNSKLKTIYGEDLYSKEQKEVVDEANEDIADAFLRDIFNKKQKPRNEDEDEDEDKNELSKSIIEMCKQKTETEKQRLEAAKKATKELEETNKEERIFFKRATHMITILVTVMCICMVIKLFIRH